MKRCFLLFNCLLLCLAARSQSLYTCRYWFDQNHEQAMTTTFDGDFLQIDVDAGSLSAGLHNIYLTVQDTTGIWCAPRSYLFYQTSAELPVNPNDVLCYFWFDQGYTNKQTMPFGTGQFLLNADDLEAGIHMLNVVLEYDDKTSAEHYLFYKVSAETPINPNEVECHFWFDQDFEHKQTMPFGTGQFLLNADGLEAGLHMLNVTLEENNVLTTTNQYLFYQTSAEEPANPSEVLCHFWFDEDFENRQTVPFGTSAFLLDASELEDGSHILYIILEKGSLTTTESYSFEKGTANGYMIISVVQPAHSGTIIEEQSRNMGEYPAGSTCTLTAVPKPGYTFNNWTEDGEQISVDSVYSFTVSNSRILVANFDGESICDDYYFMENAILCEGTSYTWRGNTYTESGIYYDSLQTVYGCDSIFQLSLELFNTPLGEFAGMTPTNNYPFASLPITFSWDAVSGAEYYNLYLWNANDPAPSEPVASNIYNRSYYASSLQNHQTYHWYVEAVNTCFTMESSVRSFTLNIPPTMYASTGSLDFGEVAINNSNTLSLYVSGNALDDAITLQITGEDASMFSFEQGSNWHGLTGGSLSVTFSPTAVQYNYSANLVITTGTLTKTVQLTGSLADMFVFNTYVTQDVFEMNSTIPIYGTVTDVNNNPMAGAEVEVKVKVMGTTRSLFSTTGDDGHFSVEFVPAYSESGYYTVNSGRVGHNSTAVHDDFNIPGMNLVTNGWILWDVVQNETTTGSIVIRNRSQIPLTNIQVTATNLPEGCSFTFQPLSLQGMEEGVLEYSVTGSALTSGNNYEEVRLVATSAEGATMNFSAWYYCVEPRGILYAAPNNITTTMTKGNSKIVDVMLYNNGTGPTGDVYLDLPSVDWLSVVGNDTLPSIAVHDSAYFSLRLSANENTSLVQYTGNIAINCERGDGLSLPYSITAVSDSTGTLVVDMTDDYTYNGNGQHLAGATVTVKGYYSLQTVATGLTGSNGTFTVEDIPEGYYRMSITAPHHAEYQATIQIEGGQTNTQNIYLQYQAITYSWNVVPTEIPDEYSFELVVVFETNVPIPVVTIEMPETFPELEDGESFVFDYIVTNHGLINSYDATLYPPTGHPLYDFTPLITEIDTLRAQETITIPCTLTRRNSQRSQKVEEALGGNRDDECPYMARTRIRSFYICGGERRPIYGYRLVNIGSVPCTTDVYIHDPIHHEHEPNIYEPIIHEPVPPITWQQHGCSDDPCQSEALDELNSCPPQNNNTPKLPPFQPGNRRNN